MDERFRPLKSIRTEEQYENYKKYLTRYLDEYKLLQGKKNLSELMKKRAKDYKEGTDERVALEQRSRLIDEGKYAQALERNITAYMLTIDEYEAKKENRSLLDIIKGIMSKDEDTKEYLKRRYMKSKAEGMGIVEPVNLSLQDPYDALKEIFESYNFINIEKPERALVPVNTELNQVFSEVRGMLEECLKENGISLTQNENKQNEDKQSEKVINSAITRKIPNTKKKEKEHEERGDEI